MSARGFTLMELIIAVGVIGTVTAIAVPTFSDFRRQAACGGSARELLLLIRQAQSRSITSNYEHRVELDLPNRRYRMTRGDRSENSTPASFEDNIVYAWAPFDPAVELRATKECDSNEVTKIGLNPDGTGSSIYVCILDGQLNRKYRVGLPHSTIPKVSIEKWDREANRWE